MIRWVFAFLYIQNKIQLDIFFFFLPFLSRSFFMLCSWYKQACWCVDTCHRPPIYSPFLARIDFPSTAANRKSVKKYTRIRHCIKDFSFYTKIFSIFNPIIIGSISFHVQSHYIDENLKWCIMCIFFWNIYLRRRHASKLNFNFEDKSAPINQIGKLHIVLNPFK